MRTFYSISKVATLFALFLFLATGPVSAQGFQSTTNLNSLTVSAITGEKPQSKVWTYAGRWWMVMPNSSGTQIWRLDGSTWTSVLNIDASTATYADCKAIGSVTHILLYKGTASSLVSVEYVPGTHTYQLWTTRNTTVPITLDAGVETATIDIDGTGRMWLANAGTTSVYVRYSDSPYSSWSSPVTLATGIDDDDICAVTAFNGRIGVLWSNQATDRFGFKYHVDGDPAATWSADEVPASQSALSVGAGMADDHLNFAVASDGTIYAAVKTSYDTPGNPRIALLVRRPAGTWDDIYSVDEGGTRGIVVLNEVVGKIQVIYTASDAGGNILYRESSTSGISFGSVNTLISGGTYNNATSTKQNYSNEIVILAGTGSSAAGVLGSNGSFALNFDGVNTTADVDYVHCSNSASADITGAITLEAWVRSDGIATQSIVKKNTATTGYELSLSNNAAGGLPQNFFFRLNGNDTYRVNSTTLYPVDGTWAHVAGTYDGSVMKLYVNGVQEGGDIPGPASIATNTNNLVIGTDAGSLGTKSFNGGIDEVRVWNVARTAQEIQENYKTEISSGTGLVGRWGFNEGTGTATANSGSGVGLNGTLMNGTVVGNGPLWVPGAPFGGAVAPSVPDAPALVSPANTATGIAVSPTLSWSASSGATTYQVQVSTVSNFATTVFDLSGIASTSTTVPSLLLYNTGYFWRVNATNAQGTSEWSSVWSFTTISSAPLIEDNGAGHALDFDYTDDYVNCGNNESVQITGRAITMEAWIKPTRPTSTMAIVKKNDAIGAGYGYELYCGSAGLLYCRFNGADASRAISTTPYPTDGKWMHVAATYDGSNTRIYINGVLEGTTAYTAPIANSIKSLYIANDPTVASRFFQGSIDEVRLWNVARSDADIKANMTKKLVGNESGLVGYWRFDEISGTLMNDETANNNDGTMINMDPATDHVWSGAALGDVSAYDYVATGGYTATLTHTNGDALTATTTSGTITGLQVYRADDNALRTGSTVLAGYSLDPSRFWGVRAIGTATPTYTLVYNYSGNPSATNESGLKLLKRNAISEPAWTDALATLNINTNTLTVTGATGTEYALAVPVSSWTGGTDRDWNTVSNWSSGAVPVPATDVTIPDLANDPIISTTTQANCNNLIITGGATLTIQSDVTNSGSLIVNGTSTGNVTYIRTMPASLYRYISSPVSSASLPAGPVYRRYNEPTGQWIEATSYTPGLGYTVQANGAPVSFTGTILTSASQTGTAPYSSATKYNLNRADWGGGGWNLLGNPFTSAMIASSFITANTGSLEASYQALYVYDGAAYLYAAAAVPGYPVGSSFGNNIQAGQGFFVLANYNNVPFSFTPEMRTHNTLTPMTKSAKAEDNPWPGVQLKVQYGDKENSTLVVYNEKMSAGLNPGYDVGLLSAASDVEIYTSLVEKDNDVNFARQALPLADCDRNIIPVGIDFAKGGQVTFSAYTVQLGTYNFWLEDRTTGIFTNLKSNSYTVTLPENTYGTGRFYIIASTTTPTGIKPPQEEEKDVRIWTSNDRLIIKGEVSEKARCEVYDMNGAKILDIPLTGGELNTITLPVGSKGVLIVKMTDGVTVKTRKVALL